MEIKVYRKIVTGRKILNKFLRIPQRVSVVRVGSKESVYFVGEIPRKKELTKNIVTEIRYYKNKSIITVKTDIEQRYLRAI